MSSEYPRCPRGHVLSPDNIFYYHRKKKNGTRSSEPRCRECKSEYERNSRRRAAEQRRMIAELGYEEDAPISGTPPETKKRDWVTLTYEAFTDNTPVIINRILELIDERDFAPAPRAAEINEEIRWLTQWKDNLERQYLTASRAASAVKKANGGACLHQPAHPAAELREDDEGPPSDV